MGDVGLHILLTAQATHGHPERGMESQSNEQGLQEAQPLGSEHAQEGVLPITGCQTQSQSAEKHGARPRIGSGSPGIKGSESPGFPLSAFWRGRWGKCDLTSTDCLKQLLEFCGHQSHGTRPQSLLLAQPTPQRAL